MVPSFSDICSGDLLRIKIEVGAIDLIESPEQIFRSPVNIVTA